MIAVLLLIDPFLQASAVQAEGENHEFNAGERQVIEGEVGEDTQVITLITGDVVTINNMRDGKSTVDLESAEENGDGFRIITLDDDTFVFPNEAMPYLTAGKLDMELFNLSKLVEYEFDDHNVESVPIILEYEEIKANTFTTPSLPKGAEKKRDLKSINGAAVEAEKKQVKSFWEDVTQEEMNNRSVDSVSFNKGIEKIWLDSRVEVQIDESVSQVNAPNAWDAGYTGEGVTVAVLDTGIDPDHPDIKNQLDEAVSFVPEEVVDDKNGHGTHVASTVLGSGDASEGQYKGVAPDARLIVGKVLGDGGTGLTSWIIEGMEWAAENAEVVNMSLGGDPTDGTDPMSVAVNSLTEETGTLFVIAAGNSGGLETVGSPGAADEALTVAAIDRNDRIAGFSSRGLRYGDKAIKPDIAAPGVGIVAARSDFASGSGFYTGKSGTSMATPHVAGAAAILAQKHPEWSGTEIKHALMSSAKGIEDHKPFEVGAGALDLEAALNDVRATGSLSFGFFQWPHDEAESVERVVMYYNDSDEDITLHLEATFTKEDGTSAAEGTLTVSESDVTIPANSKEEVSVTVDPKLADLGATYQGSLVASHDGHVVARSVLAMTKEEEKYPLTIKAIDRDGSQALAYVGIVNEGRQTSMTAVDGEVELRLTPGTYSVMSLMDVDVGTPDEGVALVGDPEVLLDGPKTVELDAREVNEISANVPKKTEANYRRVEYYRSLGDQEINDIWMLPVWTERMYAAPTKAVEHGEFEMLTRWRLIKPYLTIKARGTDLNLLPMGGSTLIEGKYNLSAVYAGKGKEEDYKALNVEENAVIVDRNEEISGREQAQVALDAGANLLIIVNDKDQKFNEYVGNDTDIPLAVAGISKSQGEELISATDKGRLMLNIEMSPDTPYVYDLVDVHTNHIPDNLAYAPKPKELVKIDSRYKSDREAPGAEFRYDMRPHTFRAMGFPQRLSLPAEREEWVSAPQDTTWYQKAEVLDNRWEIRPPAVSYEPGQRLQQDWFSPIVRPRFGEGFWTPHRQNNSASINVPSWADSGVGHTGSNLGDNSSQQQKLQLWQGDTLLSESNTQAIYASDILAEERTEYRIVNEATRDEERWNTSVRTHTEWTFETEKPEDWQAYFPLLSLDYNVDTNMNGEAVAGRSTNLELSVATIDGVDGYGEIEGATLKASFDEGKTWKEVKLEREGDSFITTITSPRDASSVSIKATGWDTKGNHISQEIIKAYLLR